MTTDRRITAVVETFPVAGTFTIARGARTQATVVVVTVTDGTHVGRGECVPYPRYGETIDSVCAQIAAAGDIADRATLHARLPPGAARNAFDCALWDLDARRSGRTVADLAGLATPALPQLTCYTLSLGRPDAMADAARAAADRPLLKLKLGGDGDAERMRAVRAARPDARLVADANEAWRVAHLEDLLAVAAETGMEMIEQPLPTAEEAALAGIARPVPICADESVHTARDLPRLAGLYDAINVKLDKAGGLTEAVELARAARARNLEVMVGCMLSTSLAMAPALLLAPFADWLDLDGPLLLARDREPAIRYDGGHIVDVPAGLWG
ncbi:MAG: N-acetyl-D-Glu racemase DgcA [Hyphomicrobiaceae bacterium]